MKKLISVLLPLLALCLQAGAQKASVSTNLMEYVNLLTLNAGGSYAMGQHWSAVAELRYNPFSYGSDDDEFRSRQRTFGAGVRYWPWHVYSGWWFGGRMQYQEYNVGGITSERTQEGDRYGLGASGGYSHMLRKNLNLEFGLGLWGGFDKYTVYTCPTCGLTEESGRKFFVLPNEFLVGVSYIF